jgi:hypothetical protein
MYGYLMLGLPETEAELKNHRTKNEQMLTDVRLSEQLTVSDQMFIASTSSPYFGNTFVVRSWLVTSGKTAKRV